MKIEVGKAIEDIEWWDESVLEDNRPGCLDSAVVLKKAVHDLLARIAELEREWDAAVKAEREACAAGCREAVGHYSNPAYGLAAEAIAAAIRARSSP